MVMNEISFFFFFWSNHTVESLCRRPEKNATIEVRPWYANSVQYVLYILLGWETMWTYVYNCFGCCFPALFKGVCINCVFLHLAFISEVLLKSKWSNYTFLMTILELRGENSSIYCYIFPSFLTIKAEVTAVVYIVKLFKINAMRWHVKLLVVQWILSREIDTAIRVQVRDVVICIPHSANTS